MLSLLQWYQAGPYKPANHQPWLLAFLLFAAPNIAQHNDEQETETEHASETERHADHDEDERIGTLSSPLGKTQRNVSAAIAGDVVAVAKLTGVDAFEVQGFFDSTKSAVRFAQKLAVAQRANVVVVVNATSISVCYTNPGCGSPVKAATASRRAPARDERRSISWSKT